MKSTTKQEMIMSKLEIKKYEVTMKQGKKYWKCFTSANSAFNAMYQMSIKYMTSQAIGARVVEE
jgi:hypothetical protein